MNGYIIKIFGIMIADFQLEDKVGRPRFFRKTLLVANTKFKAILEMLFLKFSNANILFGKKTLTQKSYTTSKILPTIKQIQIINKKDFVIAMLDINYKTFIMHIVIQKQEKILIHFERQDQFEVEAHICTQGQNRAQVKTLSFDEAFNEILVEYSDYNNFFSIENAAKLPENIKMNKHAIKLEEGKQPPFRPIYSLGPIKLETLKTYIKTNLDNSFIYIFKSPIRVFILFDKKPDESLCFCVEYQDFNN